MNVNINENDLNQEKEVSILKLFKILWLNRLIILFITLVFSVSGIVYSYSLPIKYKSQTLMIPIEQSSRPTTSGLGGLASLAGVSIKDDSSSAAIALQVLKSRKFTKDFIASRGILEQMMGTKGWDRDSDTLIYNFDIYDSKNGLWKRQVSPPRTPKPNSQEAYKYWTQEVFSVSEDRKTGWVNLSIEFYSPNIAQQWLEWLVEDLNNHMRDDVLNQADRAIQYLDNEISKTSSADLQNLFYALIKDNTEKKMLAFTDDNFIFKIIDPPISPYLKSYPQRSIIVISMFFIGLFIASLYVLLRNFYSFKPTN
jgi:LPS O-antigen subunit length determinant protein (WzzB/FepE family)